MEARRDDRSRRRRSTALLLAALAAGSGCRADVWVEGPDERRAEPVDSAPVVAAEVDTVYRPFRIDSTAASFAWLVERPAPRLPSERRYPENPVEAVRQFVRALAQTGSSRRGPVGVGQTGYDRAFTYVHPRVRGSRTAAEWAPSLAGLVRPAVVDLAPVPADSSRVFAELLVLREVADQPLLGLYYGHFTTARGDNGWQVTGARLASQDWSAAVVRGEAWRFDRAAAAREFAVEDPAYARDLVRLKSGEWVPLARPAHARDLTLGLPDAR